MDIGPAFTTYFNHCATMRYDPTMIADFLALNGVLFLEKTPTVQQQRFFGDKYASILSTMKRYMLVPEDESIDAGLAAVRQWKDAYNKVVWRSDDNDKARAALEEAVENSKKSSLRKLFLHGCSNFYSKGHGPVTEADLTSSFIVPMLACIMNKPEQSRLAHTATTATTGSLFVRLCKDLNTLPKHPDLIVKHQKTLDIGFGEVSYSKEFTKDQGDLCRLAIWSKRAIDQLQAQYEGLDDLDLPFFQAVSKDCTIYQMRRIGSICVAVELGKLEIVQDLASLVSFKEDHVFVWLKLEKLFTRLWGLMANAKERQDTSTAPHCYHGLSTPSARKMPKH
ncbi:MAG: hypothetical protein J3Q66DRAFT_200232 [Benniella sp.]|nr:MAG: hypothetical protein J3Q66DRAFT_200232 [Benniella sp.]